MLPSVSESTLFTVTSTIQYEARSYNWLKVHKVSPNKRVRLSKIKDSAMHKKQKPTTHNLQILNINNGGQLQSHCHTHPYVHVFIGSV